MWQRLQIHHGVWSYNSMHLSELMEIHILHFIIQVFQVQWHNSHGMERILQRMLIFQFQVRLNFQRVHYLLQVRYLRFQTQLKR